MKPHPSFVIVAICVLLAGCASMDKSRHAKNPGRDEAVRHASVEWDRLYNAADAAGLAALYAEDVVSMPPNAPTLKGRSALQADFQGFFAANTARHETTVDEIVRDGDLAIERAHYRLTYKPRTGGPEVVETGRHLECRKKIGGAWQIIIEIWNVDPPPGK